MTTAKTLTDAELYDLLGSAGSERDHRLMALVKCALGEMHTTVYRGRGVGKELAGAGTEEGGRAVAPGVEAQRKQLVMGFLASLHDRVRDRVVLTLDVNGATLARIYGPDVNRRIASNGTHCAVIELRRRAIEPQWSKF